MHRKDESLEIEQEILNETQLTEEEAKKEVNEKHLWNLPSKLWRPEKPSKIYWKVF